MAANVVQVRDVIPVSPHPNSNSTGSTTESTLPLTYFDTFWLKFPPVERLFFYQLTDITHHLFDSVILPSLTRSLSLSLSSTTSLSPERSSGPCRLPSRPSSTPLTTPSPSPSLSPPPTTSIAFPRMMSMKLSRFNLSRQSCIHRKSINKVRNLPSIDGSRCLKQGWTPLRARDPPKIFEKEKLYVNLYKN
ncbi:hypothetical protein ACOSP7_028142 [Xanthoceras sorbifolium]